MRYCPLNKGTVVAKEQADIFFLSLLIAPTGLNRYSFPFLCMVIVPYSKSGIVPRSSLSGAGQLGFWEFGKGGTIG